MKTKRYTLNSLEDVRNWKALKKEELDLEKLKFDAEKGNYKKEFNKGFTEVLLMEGALLLGEKVVMSALKSVFKSKKKSKKKEETNSDHTKDPEYGQEV